MKTLKRTRTYHSTYRRNESSCDCCVICGKLVKGRKKSMIYLANDFDTALTPEEAAKDPHNMGSFPIGSDCLKKNPDLKRYVWIWDQDEWDAREIIRLEDI